MLTMTKGINGRTFPPDAPLAEIVPRAAAAGFHAFEPVLSDSGPLHIDSDEKALRDAGETIRNAGLDVPSIATDLFGKHNLASPDPAERTRARDIAVAMLDRARWIGAPAILVIPGVVGRWNDKTPCARYADVLARAATALHDLDTEAETHGVKIALENAGNRFLLSPVEMREFLDRINSPWIGAGLDVGDILHVGYPQDWIAELDYRIVRVHVNDVRLGAGNPDAFCPLGDGDVDWPAVIAALRRIGYDGPLTYEGPGDPDDIAKRLDRILAATA
jgi:L-ribulose-5-phosphate 3-epimerase